MVYFGPQTVVYSDESAELRQTPSCFFMRNDVVPNNSSKAAESNQVKQEVIGAMIL